MELFVDSHSFVTAVIATALVVIAYFVGKYGISVVGEYRREGRAKLRLTPSADRAHDQVEPDDGEAE